MKIKALTCFSLNLKKKESISDNADQVYKMLSYRRETALQGAL